METIYILNWDSDDTNTDTYGSQIIYQNDGSVRYQNDLQPAGKKIHWWQSNYFGDPDPLQSSRYGSKRLPQIPRNQTFSLMFKGEVIPESSIGLTVRSFDESGQLIDQKMTLAETLDFQLNDEEPAYEIALVKFNNTKMQFQDLLMIPETVKAQYQIKAHLKQGFLDFIPRELVHNKRGNIIVRQAHRVVDAIPLPEQTLKEPLRVVLINERWTNQHLQQVANDFKNQFQLQEINWSASDLKAQALLNRK